MAAAAGAAGGATGSGQGPAPAVAATLAAPASAAGTGANAAAVLSPVDAAVLLAAGGETSGGSPLNKHIQQLKEEQATLLASRKRSQKDLRNAERKKRRLRDRARQLTDDDLVSVLMMRKDLKKNDNAADANAAVAPGDDDNGGDGEALDE